ncbi:hypothetical protein [Entomohabitans teleogrylli]|uniref:hypothetical protein n=1 Tax=Entomohabitans teleogrylli TaxID=1384589 RepID=UPI00073D48F2|nr:hypothetical protein [Entomohabitans teleogrylli]
MKKIIQTVYFMILVMAVITVITGDGWYCKVGSSSCKAARSAARKAEREAAAYSRPAVYLILDMEFVIPQELIPYRYTPPCAEKIAVWPGGRKRVPFMLLKRGDILELKIDYQSFLTTETHQEIKASWGRGIVFKSEMPVAMFPDAILMEITDSESEPKITFSMEYPTKSKVTENETGEKLICELGSMSITSKQLRFLLK